MSVRLVDLYPVVFRSNCKQKLYVKLTEDNIDAKLLEAKIQPMEKQTILHSPNYRIDEEDRYSYMPSMESENGYFCFEYDFKDEQCYSLKIRYDGNTVSNTYVYCADDDLLCLKPQKGDTHLHTNCSDGEGTPFEVSCAYRAAGFDFIAITDHHKFEPSVQAQSEVSALTKEFNVFTGEEVHNKGMGYFHIVNFNGKSSVNEIIENDDEYVEREIQKIIDTHDFSTLSDPRCVAYRIFIANEIRKAGGVAIMAHPFWEAYGEYHMQTEEFIYHWKNADFDALEVVAGCDAVGHGNNLQETLRCDMLADGYKIPIVGSSDAHHTEIKYDYDKFNVQFTIVFAHDFDDVPNAIKEERAVAVEVFDDLHFHVVGKFRYAKYARFLLKEYFPVYEKLTYKHAKALETKDLSKIAAIEQEIDAFKSKFFAR